MVAVKNHKHAMDNFYAHLHEEITLEGILDSPDASTNNPIVADPLRYYDMCPVSDGAACLILTTADIAKKNRQTDGQAGRSWHSNRYSCCS